MTECSKDNLNFLAIHFLFFVFVYLVEKENVLAVGGSELGKVHCFNLILICICLAELKGR